ncbi:MAG: prolipoprotein diacylglyceryl transferase, partial [Rikenellaceae bacterium]
EIITEIRGGGRASHGAAVGLVVGVWLFSRKNKLPLLWSVDRLIILVGISCALIRLGNLFNSEIFGYPTDLPWAFRFLDSRKWVMEAAPMGCHPTQIYEGGLYLIVFIISMVMYYRYDLARRRPGLIFGVAMIGLFTSRFVVEFVKFDQVDFESGMLLDMGQILSLPFMAWGAWMLYGALRRPEVSAKEIAETEKKNRKNR